MRIPVILFLVAAAQPAYSACMNYADLKMGATEIDKLYGELDRLVCLYNEQARYMANQEVRIKELERQVEQIGTLALDHEMRLSGER